MTESPYIGVAEMLSDLDWIDVESSHLEQVAWQLGKDGETGTLAIRFKNQSIYLYFEIPYEVFCALVDAPSSGEYLNQKIKPIYPVMKVA